MTWLSSRHGANTLYSHNTCLNCKSCSVSRADMKVSDEPPSQILNNSRPTTRDHLDGFELDESCMLDLVPGGGPVDPKTATVS
ncbi:hypothetical protein Q3G72_000217 [Acer saccharum]|nr:hypothetical protein Q3G72_000217 [Acer saccharum]